jgi:hypothetical protein
MRFTEATKPDRKSGGSRGICSSLDQQSPTVEHADLHDFQSFGEPGAPVLCLHPSVPIWFCFEPERQRRGLCYLPFE